MEQIEKSWLDLPLELRQLILEQSEQHNLAKIAISTVPELNLSLWLHPKFISSLLLMDECLNTQVTTCFQCGFTMGGAQKYDELGNEEFDVKISGLFRKLEEDQAKCEVSWTIQHADGTSRAKFVLAENYREAASTVFQKFLNFSKNHVKTIEMYWDQRNLMVDPKNFRKLREITQITVDKRKTHGIGYDFEDVLTWKTLRSVNINTNHWKIENYRRFIVTWLEKAEKIELNFGSRTFYITKLENIKSKLDKSVIFQGLDHQLWAYESFKRYLFTHPKFSDYFLMVDLNLQEGHAQFTVEKFSKKSKSWMIYVRQVYDVTKIDRFMTSEQQYSESSV